MPEQPLQIGDLALRLAVLLGQKLDGVLAGDAAGVSLVEAEHRRASLGNAVQADDRDTSLLRHLQGRTEGIDVDEVDGDGIDTSLIRFSTACTCLLTSPSPLVTRSSKP